MKKDLQKKLAGLYKSDYNLWNALNTFYYEFDEIKASVMRNRNELKTIGRVRDYIYARYGLMPSVLMVGALHKKDRDEALRSCFV